MQHNAEYVAWLEAELGWAYLRIMGDTDETQEVAGWRAFNGWKRLAGRVGSAHDDVMYDHIESECATQYDGSEG